MSGKTSVLVVGIGGYGNIYIKALLSALKENKINISGFVDPYPEACKHFDEIKALKIPIHNDIQTFYLNNNADLAVISSPIQYHCEQTCIALKNGSNVLCEKPIAASIEEANRMIAERDKSGKFLQIGYQWSFSKAILGLKSDIISGKYGKPIKLKTIVLWPRDHFYYSRGSGWAGKIKDKEGKLILDSVVSNATAHFLHNMFFVLGDSLTKSAMPIFVKAETYRANNIENFDTVAIKLKTQECPELLYLASHAVNENYGPIFEYVFENATIRYGGDRGSHIISNDSNGNIVDYGDPFDEVLNKLWLCVMAVRSSTLLPCPIEAAIPHLKCVEILHKAFKIENFPSELVVHDNVNNLTYANNLTEDLKNCFELESLPQETGVSWAIKTAPYEIS